MNKLLKHTRRHDVTFCRNGCISITARVARTLDIKPGDSVNIAQHENEYLLYAVHADGSGFRRYARCYPTNKGGNNYRTYSVQLCRALMSALNITSDRVSYMVGKSVEINGTIYLPMITRLPL